MSLFRPLTEIEINEDEVMLLYLDADQRQSLLNGESVSWRFPRQRMKNAVEFAMKVYNLTELEALQQLNDPKGWIERTLVARNRERLGKKYEEAGLPPIDYDHVTGIC